MVALAVPDNRFYSRPFSEQFVLFGFHVSGVRSFRDIRYHDLRVSRHLLSPVAPVAGQNAYFPSVQAARLLLRPVYRAAVILVPEGHGSDDDAVPQTDERDFVAEFVFLVLLALADTEYIRLMEGVDLVPVYTFTIYKLQAKRQVFTPRAVRRQLAEQLS